MDLPLASPQESICHFQGRTYMRSNLFYTLKELLISNFPCWHLSRGVKSLFVCLCVCVCVTEYVCVCACLGTSPPFPQILLSPFPSSLFFPSFFFFTDSLWHMYTVLSLEHTLFPILCPLQSTVENTHQKLSTEPTPWYLFKHFLQV